MHELGLTQKLVEIAEYHSQGKPVKSVTLLIGEFSGVDADAIQFCFDVCARSSLLKDANLKIQSVKAKARCDICNSEFLYTKVGQLCPNGHSQYQMISGKELSLTTLEFY